MTNLALYADGELWGLACRAKALRVNGAAQLQGEVSLDGETFPRLLAGLGLPQQTAEALCRALALPEARAAFFYGGGRMGFAANCPGLCFAAARGPETAVVLALETARLAGAENLLLKGTYQAARFFCIEQLYFQYGRGQLPPRGWNCLLSCRTGRSKARCCCMAACALRAAKARLPKACGNFWAWRNWGLRRLRQAKRPPPGCM